MKKNKFLKIISRNFHVYKMSYTMFLFGIWAVFSILGNIYGTLYLALGFLPILIWGILFTNDRENTDL